MADSLFDYAEDIRTSSKVGQDDLQIAEYRSQSSSKTTQKNSSETVNARALKNMLEMQKHRCALSGLPLTIENIELDHIVPLSDGGQHVMSNVQLVCRAANRMKGTMKQDEFVQMCGRIAEYQGTSQR